MDLEAQLDLICGDGGVIGGLTTWKKAVGKLGYFSGDGKKSRMSILPSACVRHLPELKFEIFVRRVFRTGT